MAEGVDRLIAGRYRLVRTLGRGGMGVVWHARDELLERDVAVKEVNLPVGSESDPAIRRILREARSAAALKDPGIITVHDVVTDGARPFIVKELVNGRSLAELGPLPEHRVAEIGRQVLRALTAAHVKGILHRDVKPANILLDDDHAVLTDFGVAAMTDGTVLTRTDQLVGSPEYLAPERINGREAAPAADLWAFGVTLYAAMAGRSPFRRSDPQTTLAAIITHDPDPLAGAERLTAQRAADLLATVVAPVTTVRPRPWSRIRQARSRSPRTPPRAPGRRSRSPTQHPAPPDQARSP